MYPGSLDGVKHRGLAETRNEHWVETHKVETHRLAKQKSERREWTAANWSIHHILPQLVFALNPPNLGLLAVLIAS